MTGPFRCVVFAGLVVVGCGDDSSTSGNDASIPDGLVVTWSSTPATWPGDLGGGLTIDRAVLALDRLRIVGDAAPGDPRTTITSREIAWSVDALPAPIAFPDAPGGVYSQLSLRIDGLVAGPSIEVQGTVMNTAYRIVDDMPTAITLAIDATFSPPSPTAIRLAVDFAAVLQAINFTAITPENGRIELDNADPQMALFRTTLVENIRVVP
jgi:hypothetical protein